MMNERAPTDGAFARVLGWSLSDSPFETPWDDFVWRVNWQLMDECIQRESDRVLRKFDALVAQDDAPPLTAEERELCACLLEIG